MAETGAQPSTPIVDLTNLPPDRPADPGPPSTNAPAPGGTMPMPGALVASDRDLLDSFDGAALSREAASLKASLAQMASLPDPREHRGMGVVNRKQVAEWVEGSGRTLGELASAIAGAAAGQRADIAGVRNTIIDVAARKYFGPKDGREKGVEAFDDRALEPFWFWETRSMADLPESMRSAAGSSRRKRRQLQARLTVVVDVLKLLEAAKVKWPSTTILRRAFERINCTPGLKDITEEESAREQTSAKKEADRLEKRQQNAEGSENPAPKSVQKPARSQFAGFGSQQTLSKAQNLFKSFFSKAELVVDDSDKQAGSPGDREEQAQQELPYMRVFRPCPPHRRLPTPMAQTKSHDAMLNSDWSDERLLEDQNAMKLCWKQQSLTRKRLPGVPPSWARKKAACLDFHEMAVKLYGEGYNKDDLRVVRRKYLWFPADSDCPAYYGSWPQNSHVRPRNPFCKAPDVNYSEMFDEDWEPEPEGENLSDGDDVEDDNGEDADMGDGFVVEDGYLSEEEGVGELMDVASAVDGEGRVQDADDGAAAICPSSQRSEVQLKMLEKLLKSALRRGQPLVISRQRGIEATEDPEQTGLAHVDPALLSVLKLVFAPGAHVGIPEPGLVPIANKADREKRSTGRPRSSAMTPELTSELVRFLRQSKGMSREKVVEAFVSQNGRSTSKKRVRDKIAEVAEYDRTSHGWIINERLPEVANVLQQAQGHRLLNGGTIRAAGPLATLGQNVVGHREPQTCLCNSSSSAVPVASCPQRWQQPGLGTADAIAGIARPSLCPVTSMAPFLSVPLSSLQPGESVPPLKRLKDAGQAL